MANRNSEFNKYSKEYLGEFLKNARIRRHFKQNEIAKEFKINLCDIEKGGRTVSDKILEKLSKKYEVPLEEIMERKYWPQLRLLSCIMRPTDVTADVLKDFKSEFSDKEMEDILDEVKRYTAFLLLSRHSLRET